LTSASTTAAVRHHRRFRNNDMSVS